MGPDTTVTDLVQGICLVVLALTCILQGLAILNLSKASRFHSTAINALSRRHDGA